LLGETYPRMLALFRRLSDDEETARDLCQSLYLKLLEDGCRRLRAFDGSLGVPFPTYLRVLATNLHIDWTRSREGRDRRRWIDLAGLRDILPDPVGVEEGDAVERVESSLSDLPPRDAAALRMRIAGFSYEEIARSTGLTEGGVAARISRARSRLRDLLEHPAERGNAWKRTPPFTSYEG